MGNTTIQTQSFRAVDAEQSKSKRYIIPFALLCSLFFLWAVANNLNDILLPQFQQAFTLTNFQAGLIQSAFYFGYFVIPIPAGILMKKLSYKAGIITGLFLYAVGAALFWPAAEIMNYTLFLIGLFIIAAGFQGQRHWTDQYPNGDTAEALLNSSFDWNGVREPFVVATENDSLNGVAMLFGHQLTGTAQIFADVRTYWSPEAVERVTGQALSGLAEHGIIHLINSGSAALDGACKQRDSEGKPTMKPHWEISQQEADACLAATEWCPAIHEYFRGGGYSSRFLTEGGVPFTMTRVNIIKGLGPVLQIAEGWSVELPKAMHDQLDARTNSTWPNTWFAPRLTGKGPFTDVYSVMANWGANHGVLTIGHVGADFITLAAMLRIPVCMHNVEEAKIYRPSAWAAHGMDIEGQDYRACQNYGPLYKR